MCAAKPVRMPSASAVAALALACCAGAQAAVIDPELEREMQRRAPQEEIAVIISLTGKVDHRRFAVQDRSQRDTRLYRELKGKAAVAQASHKAFLQGRGARRMRELWAINSIAVTARADVIRELAARMGVASIRPDS